MSVHDQHKLLISAYVDGELSQEDKLKAEELILNDRACQQYYRELTQLSTALTHWQDEGVSADLSAKIQRVLHEKKIKEENKTMKTTSFRIPVGGGLAVTFALLLIISIVALRPGGIVQMTYGPQRKSEIEKVGALNKQKSDIGFKTQSPLPAAKAVPAENVAQFEPYYLASQHSSSRAEGQPMQLTDSSTALARETGSRTRAIGGFQQSQYSVPTTPASSYEYWGAGMDKELEEKGYAIERDDSWRYNDNFSTEDYNRIYENAFLEVVENPLSTFSIDVDTAAYSNIRRFLNAGQLPPEDAVRIEEMINYFSYDYPQPTGEDPFSITTQAAICPWNTEHQLMMVGLQGKTLEGAAIPPSNLVFLIDVSGSMNEPNKLPLLQQSFKMMAQQLSDREKVSIVVYAGAAGVVLEPTSGANKQKILEAIDRLQAGGSTAGSAGIQRAYELAKEQFIQGGNNRVILATDGDFNVGVSSDAELIRIIEEKRKDGIFLTVLGFGTGNYKDNKMEQLADKGNGNFYYIDTINEGQKVMVSELGSTLFAIAKDVKVQIEFNPAKVKAYRLIGYENRMLAKEDFNDDTKDAGELGAGHSVTAIYELVPADAKEEFGEVDPLKYQANKVVASEELVTVKLRYKEPDGDTSKLITKSLSSQAITQELQGDFQFAASVAEFGLLLRNSEHKKNASYNHVLSAAQASTGKDEFGYRAEFIELIKKARTLDVRPSTTGIQFK